MFGVAQTQSDFPFVRQIVLKFYFRVHKWFGKVAALALFYHLGASCSLLFADTLQHTWMNKIALAMDLATPISLAWMGMEAILFRKKKNISKVNPFVIGNIPINAVSFFFGAYSLYGNGTLLHPFHRRSRNYCKN